MGKEAINTTEETVVKNNLENKETNEKISVESPKIKDKILMQTDKIGATSEGKLAKGFIVGTIFGILLIIGFNFAKEKGWIKIK